MKDLIRARIWCGLKMGVRAEAENLTGQHGTLIAGGQVLMAVNANMLVFIMLGKKRLLERWRVVFQKTTGASVLLFV